MIQSNRLLEITCVLWVLSGAGLANASEAAKNDRKPANSSWIDCSAHSANDEMNAIHMADGRGNGAVFEIDGASATLVNKDNELREELKNDSVKFKFKLFDEVAEIAFKQGKIVQKSSWARGSTVVYRIEPTVTYRGQKIKMFGTCVSYN